MGRLSTALHVATRPSSPACVHGALSWFTSELLSHSHRYRPRNPEVFCGLYLVSVHKPMQVCACKRPSSHGTGMIQCTAGIHCAAWARARGRRCSNIIAPATRIHPTCWHDVPCARMDVPALHAKHKYSCNSTFDAQSATHKEHETAFIDYFQFIPELVETLPLPAPSRCGVTSRGLDVLAGATPSTYMYMD